LCGCLPFEAQDKQLTAALILWADVTYWPDSISPECVSFIQACLTKDPEQRPSAKMLLEHPWLVRSCAGEVLQSQRALRDAQKPPETGQQSWKDLFSSAWAAITDVLSVPPDEPQAEGYDDQPSSLNLCALPVHDQGTRK